MVTVTFPKPYPPTTLTSSVSGFFGFGALVLKVRGNSTHVVPVRFFEVTLVTKYGATCLRAALIAARRLVEMELTAVLDGLEA